MKKISLKKFIAHFGENLRKEKRFCFILGAGASKSSGIPTGWDLVQQWVKELNETDKEDFTKWREEKGIQEDDYASHYSEIFDKRFELSKKNGFAFLEQTMENKEPSCGYSVLAQILAGGNHNIVITTNFDSLTEDALFIYTNKKPLVIGHASLANYISTNLSRPIIIKIHHDLLLSPKNGEIDVACMDENFSKNLKDVFKYYTPLVIGYGGNDGSLMNFLDKLDHFEEGLFWFFMNENEPKKEIIDFVSKSNGRFVPINGFDDLMIQLGDKLKLEKLDSEIEKIAKDRADNYRKQIEEISNRKTTDDVTKEAMTNIASRGPLTWWNYQLLAQKEKDIEKANEVYLKGIKEFPQSSGLIGNYALFLHEIRKRYDEAEEFYLKVLEIAPEDATFNGNYALFLTDIRKNYDEAERYYLKALEIEPEGANNNANYAIFLSDIRKRYDESEKYYLKAIENDSQNTNYIGNYAIFLSETRKRYYEAEQYYIKILVINPENANINGNYAKLLVICNRKDEAIKYINKAFELNKEVENGLLIELWFYCYSIFPQEFPQSKMKLEELLAKGIKSIRWDLSEILKIAEKENHPDYAQLVEFAKQITEE